LLKPEWEQLRSDAIALKGCNGTDEDVLTYAMFPQVAPKFFATRHEGPKNLGKDPVKAAATTAAAAGPAKEAGKGNGAGNGEAAKYAITINGQVHTVTVEQSR
jgi:methylmalonyl-CoA carboxyltransferase 5S subunit